MNEAELLSQSATAEEYNVGLQTITDLVRCWNLPTQPMTNGKAKGLNKAARKVIRRALNIKETKPVKRAVEATV